ncbi:hypothetical protein KIW84_031605 [Lathyrus oleraceus]|uniref:Uncharacterized protein n=1 Tax=Pisum sativum TaxID=3888 RepID=A0A9D5AVF9_PEA|nr:hypothetical protein KIW84_031605 [Pisum sativum]
MSTLADAAPVTITVPGPIPYDNDDAVPWDYGGEVYCNGEKQEDQAVGETTVSKVDNARPSGFTRSGRLFAPDTLRGGEGEKENKDKAEALARARGKQVVSEGTPIATPAPGGSGKELDDEAEEFLRIIKKSEYKLVDHLQQTPSKISILSLLLSSEGHIEALLKILKRAYVPQEITINQLETVVSNVIVSHGLGFTDLDLTVDGRNHNRALHIAMECKGAVLSTCWWIPAHHSMCCQRKPCDFDFAPEIEVYLRWAGRHSLWGGRHLRKPPVIVRVENAVFVKEEKKPSISSCKQAAEVVKSGEAPGRRQPFTFTSAGMLDPYHICAVGEETDSDCELDGWIKPCVPGMEIQNWKADKIITVTLREECDLSPDLIDNNPVTPSYDFDNPIYHAEEEGEEDCELPEELARLLKREEKVIQPHEEQVEIVNLGTEEVRKEVKVGAALEVNVKSRMVALLKEYVDIFAWSYQDMSGLDTDIVVHRLPLRADCPPVKQKLRRTRPEMAMKIKEEVQK